MRKVSVTNMLKLLTLLLCTSVIGFRLDCNRVSVLHELKISTFNFSTALLDRVSQETNGHFVFSPISTWLQLLALADGAEGETLEEIYNTTGLNSVCSREIVRQIFNSLDTELSKTIKRSSIYVIDKLLNIKDSFVDKVEMLNAAKVLQASFNKDAKVSDIVDADTKGVSTNLLDDGDFRMRVLLMSDIGVMKANWKSPFNPINTERLEFFSYKNDRVGHVNMMNQIGSFYYSSIPEIHAQAIELPFNDRTAMMLLLPYTGTAEDLFLTMQGVNMAQLLKSLKSNGPKLINLKMPRFNLSTDIDNMPELLDDMGLIRMFSPERAEFKKISDYRVYVSMMVNKFDIEVTETGVVANIAPENMANRDDAIDVTFNRPFVFLLVDKTIDVIFFGGIYSKPSLF